MKLKFKFIVMLILVAASAYGQQNPTNLKIGDQVPSIVMPKVINNTKRSLNINEFKDKLLILDFWDTMCKACIEALPKIHALQQQFGDKVKILPITHESEALITKFMVTNKLVKGLKIPSVVEDKIVKQWFSFIAKPHEVWIYKGKVIAITSGEYVDAKNIQTILDGKDLRLPIKNDFYRYDYSLPFFTSDASNSLGYVAVTGYREGAKITPLTTKRDSIRGNYSTHFINLPIVGAYRMLWSELTNVNMIGSAGGSKSGGVSPNQLILEVKDKDRYIYDSERDYRESWHRKNDISYEWIARDNPPGLKERNQIIIDDLDRLLGLKGRWEKRQVKCLIIVRTDSIAWIKTTDNEPNFEYKGKIKKLRNYSFAGLAYYLNGFTENPPVFDGTGYTGNINMDLEFDSWTDIPAIRKALQKYGLDLKEEARELDMFVLTETN